MKKSIIALALSVFLFAGCGGGAENTGGNAAETTADVTTAPATEASALEVRGDTYVITEDKYLEGVREIYNNPDKYIGKRVEFEGEYIAELFVDEMYYQVYRNITVTERHEDEDGHVHTHAAETYPIGFRIKYDGSKPTDKTFVKVSGIIEAYESNGEEMLLVRADLLEKSDSAGEVNLRY